MATIITGRIPDVGITPIDLAVTTSSLYGDEVLKDIFRVRGTGALIEGDANVYGDLNLFEGGSLYSEGTLRSAQSITSVSGNFYESGVPVGAKIDHLKQSILKTGLVLDLDASNLNSYPKSGTFWHDLTLRGQKGSISGDNPFFNNEFRFTSDKDRFIRVEGTQGLAPQKFGFATYFQPFYDGSGSNDIVAGKSFNAADMSFGHMYKSTNRLVSTIRFTDGTKSEVQISNLDQGSYHNVFSRWDGTYHIVYTGGKFVAKDDGSHAGKSIAYSGNQPISVGAKYYDPTSSPATATDFFKGGVEAVAIYDGEFPELEVWKNDIVKTQLNLHKEVNISGGLNVNGTNIQTLVDEYTRADITGNSVGISGTSFEVVNLYGDNYQATLSGSVSTLNEYSTINNPSTTTISAGNNTLNWDSTTGTVNINNNGVGSTVLFNTEYGGSVDAVISGFLFVIEETENATIFNQQRAIVDRNSGVLTIHNSGGVTEISGENVITVQGGVLNVTGESSSGQFTVNDSTVSISLQNSQAVSLNNSTNTFNNAGQINFTGDSNVINSGTVFATGETFTINNATSTITGVSNSTFSFTSGTANVQFIENNTLNLSGAAAIGLTNNGTLSTTDGSFSINGGTHTFAVTGGTISTDSSTNNITYGTGAIDITGGTNSISIASELSDYGGSNTYNQFITATVTDGLVNNVTASSATISGNNVIFSGNISSDGIAAITGGVINFSDGSSVDRVDAESATIGSGATVPNMQFGANANVNFTSSEVTIVDDGSSQHTFNVTGNLQVTGNTVHVQQPDTQQLIVNATTGSIDFSQFQGTNSPVSITVTGSGTAILNVPVAEYGEGGDIDISSSNATVNLATGVNVDVTGTANVYQSTGVTVNAAANSTVFVESEQTGITVNNEGTATISGLRFYDFDFYNNNGGTVFISGSSIDSYSGDLTATSVDTLNFRAHSGSQNTLTATQFNLLSGNLDFTLPVNAQFTISDAVKTHIFNSGVVNATGVALISGGIINVEDSTIDSLTGQNVNAYNTAVNQAYWTVYSTGAYNFMTGEQVVIKNYGSGVVSVDILNKQSGIWSGDVNIYSGTTNISGLERATLYSGEANIFNTNSGLQPHNIDIYDSAITIDNTNAVNPSSLASGNQVTIIGGVNDITGHELVINGGTNALNVEKITGDIVLFASGNTFSLTTGNTISIYGGTGDNVFSGETVTVTVASGADADFDIISVNELNITGGTLTLNSLSGVNFDFADTQQVNLNNSTANITGSFVTANDGATVNIYGGTGVSINSGAENFFYDARDIEINGSGNTVSLSAPRDTTINSDLVNVVGGLNTLTGVATISGGINTLSIGSIDSISIDNSTNDFPLLTGTPNVTINTGVTNIYGSGTNNIYGGEIAIEGGVNNITGQTFSFLSGAVAEFVNSGTVTVNNPSQVIVHNSGGNVDVTGAENISISGGVSTISGDIVYVDTTSSISGVTAQTVYVTGLGNTGSNVYITLQSGSIDLSHMVNPDILDSTVNITSGNIITITGSTVNLTGNEFSFVDTVNTVNLNNVGSTVSISGGTNTINNSGTLNANESLTAYFGLIHNTGTVISTSAEIVNVHNGNFYASGTNAANVHVSGDAFVTGVDVDISITDSTATLLHSSSSGTLEVNATSSTIHIPTGHTGVHIHPNTGNDIYVQSGINRIEAPSTVLHGINTINSTGVVVQAGRNTIETVSGHQTQIYYGNTFVKENSGPVEVSITGGNNYIHTGLVYITGGDHTNVNIYTSENEVYLTGENPYVGIFNSTNNFTSNWTGLVQISGTSTNTIHNTGLILIDTGANNYIYGGENNLTGVNIFITGGVNTYANNLGGTTQITGGVNAIENTGGTLTITGGHNTINTGLVYITGGTNNVSLATVQISGSDVTIGTSDNFVFSNEEINIYGTTNVYASGDQAENILYLINLSGVSGEETARIFNYGTGFKVISGTSYISGENLSIHDSTVGITGGISQIYYSDVEIEQCDTVTVNNSTGIYITGITGDAHFTDSSDITVATSLNNYITGGTVTINNSSGSNSTHDIDEAVTVTINTGTVSTINVAESGTVNSNSNTDLISVTGNTTVALNANSTGAISIHDTDLLTIGANSTLSIDTITGSTVTLSSGIINMESGSDSTVHITGQNDVSINVYDELGANFYITSGDVSVGGTFDDLNVTGATVNINSTVTSASIHQPVSATIQEATSATFNQGTVTIQNTGISGTVNAFITGGTSNISNATVSITGVTVGNFQSGSVNSVTGHESTFSFEAQSINEINAPNSTLTLNNSTNTINTGNVVVNAGNTNTFISGLSFVTGDIVNITNGITNFIDKATGITIDNSTINGDLSSTGPNSNLSISGNATFSDDSSATFSSTVNSDNIHFLLGTTATFNGTNNVGLNNSGTVNINNGTVSATGGTFSIDSAGTTFTNANSSTFSVTSDSTFNNTSGIFYVTGDIEVGAHSENTIFSHDNTTITISGAADSNLNNYISGNVTVKDGNLGSVITSGNSNVYVSGSTVNTSSSSTINVNNPSNTINVTGSTNTTFNGTISSLSVTGGTTTINNANSGFTINDGTNTINTGTDITIQGTQDSIIINNSIFGYTGTAPISISGGSNTVQNTGNSDIVISGGTNFIESVDAITFSNINSITINSNTGDVTGTNLTINGGTNTVGNNSSISGGTNTINNGTSFIYSGNTNTINNGTTNITGGTTTVNGGLINIDPNQEVTLENAIISGGINTITGTTVNITGGDSFAITGTTINIKDGSTLVHNGGTVVLSEFSNSTYSANHNELVNISGTNVTINQAISNTGLTITGTTVTIEYISGGTSNFYDGTTANVTGGINSFNSNAVVQNLTGGVNTVEAGAIVHRIETATVGNNATISSGVNVDIDNVAHGNVTVTNGDTVHITGIATITNATNSTVRVSGTSTNNVTNFNNSSLTIQNGTVQIDDGFIGITGNDNTFNISNVDEVIASGLNNFYVQDGSTNHVTGVYAGVGITGGINYLNSVEGNVTVDNSFSQTIDSSASNTVVNNSFHNPTIITGGTVTITGDSTTITEFIRIYSGIVNLTLQNPVQSGLVPMIGITGGENTLNNADEVIITGANSITANNSASISFLQSTLNSVSISNSTGYMTGHTFNITGGINTCISTGQDFNLTNSESVTIDGSGNIVADSVSVNNGNNIINNHNNDIVVNYSPSIVSGVNFTVSSGNNVSIYQFRDIQSIGDDSKNLSVSTQVANITGGINHVTLTNGDAHITGATVILTGDSTSTITDVDVVNYHIHKDLTLNSPTGNIIGSIDSMTFSGDSLSVTGSVTFNNSQDIDITNADDVNSVDSNVSLITSTVGGDVNNYGGLTQFYNSTVTYNSVTGQFSNNTVFTHAASNSFVTGDIVRYDNSSNQYVKAVADSEANSRVVGVISKASGSAFDVVTHGEFELGGYSAGQQLYLSPTSAGQLTTTKPTIPGQYVKPIGVTTNDKLVVNVGESELIKSFTGTNLVMLRDPSATAAGSDTNTHYSEFTSSESIIMTKEIDLTQEGTHTIHLDSDKRMFIDEIGLIFTDVNSISLSPAWKVGVSGSLDSLFDPFRGDHTTVSNNSRERVLAPEDTQGVSNIVTTIVSGAAANTCEGKFYYKGFILETE